MTAHATTKGVQAAVALCVCCTFSVTGPAAQPSKAEEQADVVVSMVGLLANPAELDGQVVQVAGFLQHDVGLSLYLTRDHAEIADAMSSIRVQMPEASVVSCAGAYAMVVGRFGRSELGGFEILETRSISRWEPTLKRCWTRQGP